MASTTESLVQPTISMAFSRTIDETRSAPRRRTPIIGLPISMAYFLLQGGTQRRPATGVVNRVILRHRIIPPREIRMPVKKPGQGLVIIPVTPGMTNKYVIGSCHKDSSPHKNGWIADNADSIANTVPKRKTTPNRGHLRNFVFFSYYFILF